MDCVQLLKKGKLSSTGLCSTIEFSYTGLCSMIFNTEPSKLFEYVCNQFEYVEKNLLNSKMKVNNPKKAYLDTFVINILQ